METFDPASSGHLRLMAQLGITGVSDHAAMLKSQAHATALQTHLRREGNDDHSAPSNPATVIRRSSPDKLLTPAQHSETDPERIYKERKAALQRHSEKRTQPKRGGNAGAFTRLRAKLQKHLAQQDMAKAIATQVASNKGFDFEERFGKGFGPHTVEPVTIKRTPAIKPSATEKPAQSFAKSLAAAKATLAGMGFGKSLTTSANSDSATLTGGSAMRMQSLSKHVASTTAGGDPEPTAEQILKAASAALYAGQITGRDAADIERHVNATGKCPEPLLKKLRDEEADAPRVPKLLTKTQVEAACMKGMQSGAITGAEGMHANTCLSLNCPVDEGVMKKIKAVHDSK